MKGNRAALTAIVLLAVIIAGWWLFGRNRGGGRVDLIERFSEATKRPSAEIFSLADVTLGGVTKKSIAISPVGGSRLIWKLQIPDDGWLWVSVGLRPEAWEQEGDGIKFMVGISDGRAFEPLFEQHVNPFAMQGDRKWIDVRVDVSTYAGEEVELIFNTYASAQGMGGPTGDQRNDLGLWGSPEIVVR
ncbi:MAG: hypothetical protein ACRD1U_03185 [Vicinamibacterales bacterium]